MRVTRELWEWLTCLRTHRRSWSSWSAWKEAVSISGSRIIWALLKVCLDSYSGRYARLCSWYTLGALFTETLSLRIFWCTTPTLDRKITAPCRWSWLISAYRQSWLRTNGSLRLPAPWPSALPKSSGMNHTASPQTSGVSGSCYILYWQSACHSWHRLGIRRCLILGLSRLTYNNLAGKEKVD